MSKQRLMNTLEWTHSTHLQVVETTPQTQTFALRAFFDEGGSRLPQDGGHDHPINDLVLDPPQASARVPVHTPEWTHPREGDPGRTLEESDNGDAAEGKVNITVSGYVAQGPILFDGEDFDLSGLDEYAKSSIEKDGEDTSTSMGHRSGHGILIDFEDDASEIDEILKHALEPGADTDDNRTNPDVVETPTEPEPPIPHAMAQFILIVGMADAPSEDPGLDDASISATVA